MGAYEEFNKIKKIEELLKHLSVIGYSNIEEIVNKTLEEWDISDYTLARDSDKRMNEYTKGEAESAVKHVIAVDGITQIHEKFLEIAESVIDGYFYISWSDCDIRQSNEVRFDENKNFCYLLKSIFLKQDINNGIEGNTYELDMKRMVIILGKYIKNNHHQLWIKKTPTLIPAYILEQQKNIKRDTESLISKSNEKIQESNNRINNIEPKLNEAQNSIKRIEPIIKKSKRKIENINSNMITIMALFITAFSIIGINIYSLNNALGIQEILLVNSSLVFVLSILMYMLDIIINDEKLRLLIVVGITAVFFGFVIYLNYFDNDLKKVNEVEQNQTQSVEIQTNLNQAN